MDPQIPPVGKLRKHRIRNLSDPELQTGTVFDQFGAQVGETLAYRAPAGETRFFCADIELLPLTDADRYALLGRWLEANDAVTFEEDAGWTLIA